ncbi:MAG: signal peptidase I [Streptosporangiaceae bacterium]
MSGVGRGATPGAESGADAPEPAAPRDPDPAVDPAAEPETAAPPAGGATEGSDAAGAAAAGAGPAGTGAGTRTARKRRKRSFWREFPILVAIALILAVIIKTYAIQAFWIPSGSMENTLEINDRVLVNKIVYHTRPIHRGDIVVFNGDGSWDPGTVPTSGNVFQQFANGFSSMFGFGHPGDILIKRVIGLPGDHVACCNAQGLLTVNGVPLTEQSYLYPGDAPSLQRFNITVPPGRLWVMGDHRLVSDDSRDHMGDPGGGTIPESAVVGRAFVIIWPVSRWRFLPIPATFQQPKLNAAASSGAGTGAGTADDAATAALLSARLQPSGPALPLSLGFAGALPLTWLQRRVRIRAARRRDTGRRRETGRRRAVGSRRPGGDPRDPGPRRGPA